MSEDRLFHRLSGAREDPNCFVAAFGIYSLSKFVNFLTDVFFAKILSE
jgi:hypothetical protein